MFPRDIRTGREKFYANFVRAPWARMRVDHVSADFIPLVYPESCLARQTVVAYSFDLGLASAPSLSLDR